MARVKHLFGQRYLYSSILAALCLGISVIWIGALLIQKGGGSPLILGACVLIAFAALFGLPSALFGVLCASLLTMSLRPLPWLELSAAYLVLGTLLSVIFRGLRGVFSGERGDMQERVSSKLLESLATTAEVRDSHTQGHCQRVADNAVLLGERLGMSEVELDTLYWAALLHDIGKLSVPEHILKKDGRLSDKEFLEIKKHPDFGAQLLLNISNNFGDIARIVRCHHERYDGLGYPRQLRGESIPLMSRIISIVDVFEALTSQRSYRQPMLPEEAAAHLLKGANEQFDPGLIKLFKESYESKELSCACVPETAAEPLAPPRLEPALKFMTN